MTDKELIAYLKGYIAAHLHNHESDEFGHDSALTHVFNVLNKNSENL